MAKPRVRLRAEKKVVDKTVINFDKKTLDGLEKVSNSMNRLIEVISTLRDSTKNIAELSSALDGISLKDKEKVSDMMYRIKKIWAEVHHMNMTLPKVDDLNKEVADNVYSAFLSLASQLSNVNSSLEGNMSLIKEILGEVDEKKDKALN